MWARTSKRQTERERENSIDAKYTNNTYIEQYSIQYLLHLHPTKFAGCVWFRYTHFSYISMRRATRPQKKREMKRREEATTNALTRNRPKIIGVCSLSTGTRLCDINPHSTRLSFTVYICFFCCCDERREAEETKKQYNKRAIYTIAQSARIEYNKTNTKSSEMYEKKQKNIFLLHQQRTRLTNL